MTPIAFALNLKDKRVDRMLNARGLHGADIYYSPIQSWLIMLLLVLTPVVFIGVGLSWALWYGAAVVVYLLLSYLANARLYNSIALKDDRLIIVNPNFSCRQVVLYDKQSITRIVIAEYKGRQWLGWLLVFKGNYLQIECEGGVYIYHCSGLELDAFDENWTEKTIDTLADKLTELGYPVSFEAGK